MIRRCQYPGCTSPVFGGNRRRYCAKCSELVAEEHNRKNNLRQIEQRRKRREENPLLCVECGKPRSAPSHLKCADCRAAARAQAIKEREAAKVKQMTEDKPAVIELWSDRPKPPPLLTTEEQLRIDAEVAALETRRHKEYLERFGMVVRPGRPVASEARRLTAAEVAEVAKTLTPPGKSGAVMPYMGEG